MLAFWDQLDPPRSAVAVPANPRRGPGFAGAALSGRDQQGDIRALAERAGPPPAFRLDAARIASRRQRPAAAAARRWPPARSASILVAGGQGTRLGFDHPKGMYPIGPVSGRSLFQIHVEKILAVGRRHGVRIPLYLMTSPATHAETADFFARARALRPGRRRLADLLPGDDAGGRRRQRAELLEAPGRLAASPDGHGGMLAAFAASGCLDHARRRGISQLFYFQVDNPLSQICGPEHLGYHLLCGAEMSSQVIAKRDPLEQVGNVVEVDGRLVVIEYSDLPGDVARRRNADGSLAIWAGSIAVHVFDRSFLERMAASAAGLPFHVARKKMAYLDGAGRRVEPSQPNALKFERFIFDLMPSAAGAIVIEVDPAAGLRAAEERLRRKDDTPETVRAQMAALHRGWLRRRGWKWPTTWRSRSIRFSPWTPRNWPPMWPPGRRSRRRRILRRGRNEFAPQARLLLPRRSYNEWISASSRKP